MFLFAFFWFGFFLAPSFVRPDPNIIADFIEHRLYLPVLGILIFIAEIRGLEVVNRIKAKYYWLVLAVLFFFFGPLTFFHQNVFADKFTFWLNASENSPSSPLAQRNLGAMYHLEKKYDLAEKYYKRTIEINDLEPMVHSNLGLIYANRGDLTGAEREYLKEISFNPGYDNAHFNLGLLYYATKRIEQAKKEWEKTLEINPDYVDARNALEET